MVSTSAEKIAEITKRLKMSLMEKIQILSPNFAGVAAGRTPEFIEMRQAGPTTYPARRVWIR
jgi:hypothetical protein